MKRKRKEEAEVGKEEGADTNEMAVIIYPKKSSAKTNLPGGRRERVGGESVV
jgi:hypothetical protein